MGTIHAVYEDGVFRPREPVSLPNGAEVEFEPKLISPNGHSPDSLIGIYEILNRRYDTGEADAAERHNEHQP